MTKALGITLLICIVILTAIVIYALVRGDNIFRRRIAAHCFLYTLDMSCVLTGFIYGFGMEVKSWFFVVAPLIFGRIIVSIYNSVFHNSGLKRRRDDVTSDPPPQSRKSA